MSVPIDASQKEKAASSSAVFHALKALIRVMDSLNQSFQSLERRLNLVDAVPHHDTCLDDAVLNDVYQNWHTGGAFRDGERALTVSIREIEGALANNISGVLLGELKVKLEDRLTRHLEEAKALRDAFVASRDQPFLPRQPHKIRQYFLSSLLLALSPFVMEFQSARKLSDAQENLDPLVRERLLSLETKLFRLRSAVSECRDNPSQKMGKKLAEWVHEFTSIVDTITVVKMRLMHEMLRCGITFHGRCNQITFKWLPSMENADPWDFNPQAHMDAHFSVGHEPVLRENAG